MQRHGKKWSPIARHYLLKPFLVMRKSQLGRKVQKTSVVKIGLIWQTTYQLIKAVRTWYQSPETYKIIQSYSIDAIGE